MRAQTIEGAPAAFGRLQDQPLALHQLGMAGVDTPLAFSLPLVLLGLGHGLLVPAALVAQLKGEYPDLVAYAQPDGQMKLAAGWLIERAGWKGFRDADAGVHKMQALVLVNYGNATGLQLLDLAQRIQKDISERFQVDLEMEPNRY